MNQTEIKEKVLVIDDNPLNRELINAVLEERGLSYDEAASGKEALELVKTDEYWLVFVDLLMPGLDGFETIRQIRLKGSTFPIIAVSAISFKQDRQAAFEAGCDHFIPKPVDIELLIRVIDKYKGQFLKQKAARENQVDRPDSSHSQKRSFNSDKSAVDLTDISILLVEENRNQRHEFTSFLHGNGFKIQSFGNGAEAWNFITTNDIKPDIVISNIRMPEIDGLGLLAMIKRKYPSIRFFLYAPQFDADTIRLAAQESVNCIISMEKFIDTIVDIIESEFSKTESKSSQTVLKKALRQISQTQEQLIRFGCEPPCRFCDISHASLQEAGGDVASCRQFNLEGRCGIILMDVAGHDIVSSYLSAVFWGVLSSNWNSCQYPKNLANLLNKELCKLGYHNSHVCLTVILWDLQRRKLSVTQAGNPGGMKINKDQNGDIDFMELEGGGMVIGLLPENEQMIHHEFELSNECTFIFHSDGIEFQQLKSVIESADILASNPLSDISSQNLLEQLLSRHGQDDDMIIVKLNIPPKMKEDVNHLAFRADYNGVDYACKWTEAKLSAGLMPQGQDIFDVMLCIREALLNAVEHGNRRDSKKFVDLSLFPGLTDLEIRVSDEGPGFNLAGKIKEAENVDGFQVGKRGLPLMQSIADSINVAGGSVVMMFNEKKN